MKVSPAVLGTIGLTLFLAVGGGGFAAYRMYDYVQHDNEFCVSCHLMEEPFERFQTSAHRGLGCKACHQPNPIQRAKMGLTQVVKNPEVIEAHAEVPNERCEHCHVRGNPEDWLIISESRGHRLHLESADARLADLECVTCHAESIHVFGASNKACTQSGCHDELAVVLGEMRGLDLPCVVCHAFVEPPAGFPNAPHSPDSLGMAPDSKECLSCHDMRVRIAIDEATEPHGARCSTCHNAHDQRRAHDAESRCSEGACHGRARDVEDNHHKWETVDLLACVQCHRPHAFEVDGDRCITCHEDIFAEGSAAPLREPLLRPSAVSGERAAPEPSGPAPPAGEHRVAWVPLLPADGGPPSPQARDSAFTHQRHRPVACASCHTGAGSVDADNSAWCAGCHHGPRSGRACAACHAPAELEGIPAVLEFTLPGGRERRELAFAHEPHAAAAECAECHGAQPSGTAAREACLTCHERHHTSPEVLCVGCHETPPEWAHEAAVVHGGCTGGVCHERFPVAEPSLMARSVCEACHENFVGVEPLPALPEAAPRDTAGAVL